MANPSPSARRTKTRLDPLACRRIGSRLPVAARFVSLTVLLLVTGCGGIRLYPVEGTITFDGKPVSDASVMFHPKAAGPVGEAVTDSSGKFVLKCTNKPGVPAGDYSVTIMKQKTTGLSTSPDGLSPGASGTIKVEYLIPEKYGKIDSPLFTVAVPGGTYDFELTKK